MSDRSTHFRRPEIWMTVALGATVIIAGLIIAISQSVAPYGLAGGLVALGMFMLGIGLGGVLFSARKAVPSRDGA